MDVIEAPHEKTVQSLFSILNSHDKGLSAGEADERLDHYGENRLPDAKRRSAWQRFFAQFHNLLIYVLIISAILSALLAHYVDSGVIIAVVVVNAVVGFIQEGKAENALRAIMSLTSAQCLVLREGALKTIDSVNLVPGDVIMLQAGDRVPADIRLFFSKDFRCDESALTGEAHPVSKHDEVLAANTPLAERKNMAYMGTMVTYGSARGVVTHTGIWTQIGQISELVASVPMERTPLQIQLSRFTQQLTVAIILIALLTVLFGTLIHQYRLGEVFQAAVGIAVASIPEGLPAIVTIALAIGVQRMAKNKALIRRLPAVEVLGSVDIICTDKTGTLTANAMTVRAVYTAEGDFQVSGEGYRPDGAIRQLSCDKNISYPEAPVFSQACVISTLCNDAQVEHRDKDWLLHGDPTEGALAVLALKFCCTTSELQHRWPRVDVLPFESENRYMATLHHNQDGRVLLCVKGAPERLIPSASYQLGLDGPEPMNTTEWSAKTEALAKQGMRVMALAQKQYTEKPAVLSHEDAMHELVMVALVGIADPPRPEAIKSIALCHDAGIQVKMITGDNGTTAAAIGAELGLKVDRVMTGQDIDKLSTESLATAVEETDVFARASPENKLQLVSALQLNQHVVAMTGDGVNDAPALKKANIGVAMGNKGTDAAKEAADFVLTDDNFHTIARAVREGRTVYDNILKSIIFILPTNLAEALVILIAVIFGTLLPITPVQILWVNMVTAITLALALAFEQSEADVMQRRPRPFNTGLFNVSIVMRMITVGSFGAAYVFALFYYYRSSGVSIEYARTIAVNALVVTEILYLFNCRFLTQSLFNKAFLSGAGPIIYAILSVISLQLLYSYLPFSQALFQLESILFVDWLKIIVGASPVILIVEIEKFLIRKNMAGYKGVRQ